MFFLKNPSIRSAILIPLGITVCLLLAFVASIYIATSKLNNNYVSLYKQSVPEIARISSLIDEAKNIHIELNNLLNEQNELVFTTQTEKIKNQLFALHEKTIQQSENSLFQTNIEQVLKQIVDLQEIISFIEANVLQSIKLYNQEQTTIKHLHYLNEQLLSSQTEFQLNSDIRQVLEEVFMGLFVLSSNRDMFYNMKINDELQANYRQLEEFKNSIKTDNKYEKLYLLLNAVTDFMDINNGVLSQVFTYKQIQQERTSIKIFLTVRYEELNQIGNSIFEQIQTVSAENNTYFENAIEKILLLVVAIFCAIIISIVFIFRFLSNYILSPLTDIHSYIKHHEDVHACEPVHDGAKELLEISLAICEFANQLEDREIKLRDSHKNLEVQVAERTKKVRQLSNQIISLQEEERFKLAAELHDDIGSSLGTIKLSIERALLLLKNTDLDTAQTSLSDSINVVKSISRQLRRIQTDLRPPYLDVGLLKSLEWLIEDYRIAHPQIEIEADFFFDDLLLSHSLRIVTFRIIQETMNNISKHSAATKVFIKIFDSHGLTIMVVDNGQGFDLNQYQQNEHKINCGIRNIQERVSISGGVLKLYSKKGKGTRVIAHWGQTVQS